MLAISALMLIIQGHFGLNSVCVLVQARVFVCVVCVGMLVCCVYVCVHGIYRCIYQTLTRSITISITITIYMYYQTRSIEIKKRPNDKKNCMHICISPCMTLPIQLTTT